MRSLGSRAFAEFVGTFFLVFVGVGAIASGAGSAGVSLAFGAVVASMVYALGHVSGAHFNPAVSIAFLTIGRLPRHELAAYVGAQLLGTTLASFVLDGVVGLGASTGVTVVSVSIPRAFVTEVLLTFALMFVITAVATDPRVPRGVGGLAIGLAVAQGAISGGALTGASMNPARSWGPALATGSWSDHWLYWTAPIVGAVLGSLTYRGIVREEEEIELVSSGAAGRRLSQ